MSLSSDHMALSHPPIIIHDNNKNKKKIVPSTTETTTVTTKDTESSSSSSSYHDRSVLFTLEDSTTTWTNTRLVTTTTTSTTTPTRRRWRILSASDRASTTAAELPIVPNKEEGTDSSSDNTTTTSSNNCTTTTLHRSNNNNSNNNNIRTQLLQQRQLQPRIREKRRRWVSWTRFIRNPQTTSTHSTLLSQQQQQQHQQQQDRSSCSNSSCCCWPVLIPIVSSDESTKHHLCRLSTLDGSSPLLQPDRLSHQQKRKSSYVALLSTLMIVSYKIRINDRNGMIQQQQQQLPTSIDLDWSILQSYLDRMSFIIHDAHTDQLYIGKRDTILRLSVSNNNNNNITNNQQAGISPGLYFVHHDSTPHENFLWDCIERISFVLQNLDNNNDTSSSSSSFSWSVPSTFSWKRIRWDIPIVSQEKKDTTIVLFRLQGHTLLGDMFLVLERPNLAIKSYIHALWIATNNNNNNNNSRGTYPSDNDHGITTIQVIADNDADNDDNDDDDDKCAVRPSNNHHITNQRMILPIALTLHRLAKAYLAAGCYLDALQVAEKSIRLYQRNFIIINNNNKNKMTGNSNNNAPPSTTLYDDIQRIRIDATNCLGKNMTRKRRFTQTRLALIQEEDDEQDL